MNEINEPKSAKQSIFTKIKNTKKLQYAIIALLFVIIFFIIIGNGFIKNDTEEKPDSVNEYVQNLEERLEKTLSKVEGAGKVSTVITVNSGMETVLAMETIIKDTANGKETTSTPILVNGKTVVLKEKYPEIVGVLIVAEGADSISTISKIQQATIALLDVNINQVEILTMK